MNIYKHHAPKFLDKGYSVIPDRGGQKLPAIKEWSKYCAQKPTQEEFDGWSQSLPNTNISVCLGEASGIVALDLDCTDDAVIDLIKHMLPPSPVEKKGTKGWTRFYKYLQGQRTELVKHNGEVVIELLSTGKKTTIPPSQLKGLNYEWTGEKELWELSPSDLPSIPVNLLAQIRNKLTQHFPNSYIEGNNIVNGRNDEMKQLIVRLQGSGNTVDDIIKEMIKLDETFSSSLFSDPTENHHTEKYTNAGRFYFSVLNSINKENLIKKKVYDIPILSTSVSEPDKEALLVGKSQSKGISVMPKADLPTPIGALAVIQSWILDNSYIKQPAFAFSAALSVLAVAISRKFVFEGVCSNMYILNIAPSGAGKDAPQQKVKEIFFDIKKDHLLGAGDYVSDASLTDSLGSNVVRLDIIDEASGLLKCVNQGGATYNNKMADILAELYTSSNSKFLGRQTAAGRQGEAYRPNVNLLCSTTPTGFSEGVTMKSLEKGLLGRFLFFKGDYDAPANRVKKPTKLPQNILDMVDHWCGFKPSGGNQLAGITQEFHLIEATPAAHDALEKVFRSFDDMRRNTDPTHSLLPLISRMYQQMLKIIMVHSVSRSNKELPIVNETDVEFGHKAILYIFNVARELISDNVFSGSMEKNVMKVYNIIKAAGPEGISRKQIYRKTRNLTKMVRDNIYNDLLANEQIEQYNNRMRILNDTRN